MIEQTVNSEFGEYKLKLNHGHRVNISYASDLDFYKPVEDEWLDCPCCGLKPKIWEYDNGRKTMCGCGNSTYDFFSVHAESVMSVHKRTNGKRMSQYNIEELKENWNEYCATWVNPCSLEDLRIEEKW